MYGTVSPGDGDACGSDWGPLELRNAPAIAPRARRRALLERRQPHDRARDIVAIVAALVLPEAHRELDERLGGVLGAARVVAPLVEARPHALDRFGSQLSPLEPQKRALLLAYAGLLTTHGILHLLGYDHAEPEEEKEMFGLQNRILEDFYADRHRQAQQRRQSDRDTRLLTNIGFTDLTAGDNASTEDE